MNRPSRLLLTLTCTTVMLFSFQNCISFTSDSGARSKKPLPQGSQRTSGNGSVYDGKTYQFIDPKCLERNSSPISATAESIGGVLYLTSYNCERIQPRPLDPSLLKSSPHNPEIVSYQELILEDALRLSDLLTPNGSYTETICRGSFTSTYEGRQQLAYVDAVIRTNAGLLMSESKLLAEMILGHKSADSNQFKVDRLSRHIVEKNPPPGVYKHYVAEGPDSDSEYRFELTLFPSYYANFTSMDGVLEAKTLSNAYINIPVKCHVLSK